MSFSGHTARKRFGQHWLRDTAVLDRILEAADLPEGVHVTAMGSDQHSKNEIEPACLARADAYAPDRQSQTAELGELRSAIEAGCWALP